MAYSNQVHIENRIGVSNLAQITNDTAGTVTPTAAIVTSLIQKADAMINFKVGAIYATPLNKVLTGTISSSSTTLTGTSTLFTTELVIGDPMINRLTGEIRIIDSITSNTSATTATAFSTLSGATLYRIPQIIHSISVDLASYYAMQRRFSEMEMPEDWREVGRRILGTAQMTGLLDQIALLELSIGLDISSAQSAMVAPTKLIDFTDTAKTESWF